MTVIGRTTHGQCEVCGSFTPLVPRRFVPERLLNEARADEAATRQQLQGAVSAVRAIVAEMRTLAEWKPDHPVSSDALQDFATRLDAAVGGQ